MPERKLVAPPPGIETAPLFFDSYSGKFGLTGYRVNVYERDNAPAHAPMVLFKGGWGDASADSCIPLAMQAAERFGRAATISNTRISPLNLLTPLAIVRARQLRSEAFHAGLKIAAAYGVRQAVVAGQSFGGDNAVDSTLHAVREMPAHMRPEKLSVVTIDTPGVYGDLERTKGIALSMAGLVGSMLKDFKDNPQTGIWMMERMFQGRSAIESFYFGSELLSLLHIDISPQVQQLREANVLVSHVFHAGDVIPRLDDPEAALFDGGHAAALVRPAEVIDFIAHRALPDYAPPAAWAGSSLE